MTQLQSALWTVREALVASNDVMRGQLREDGLSRQAVEDNLHVERNVKALALLDQILAAVPVKAGAAVFVANYDGIPVEEIESPDAWEDVLKAAALLATITQEPKK